MEFQIWHYWVIAGVLFLILEIFTPSFIAACIGIGAIFGGLAAGIGLDFKWQIGFFAVATLASFFTVRPFMLKYAYKTSDKVKTNVDNMIGKLGMVTQKIDHSAQTGRVKIDGDDWKAEAENDEIIDTGTRVEVTGIESIILTVRPVKKE
ncbi:MAG: hypothetical protein AMS27_16855 [Bacteroides sp. SM23_62_1]|nr:MAG: hypothetical protein AMS27_16855 [Bacteroides sp. SM23_62_1]